MRSWKEEWRQKRKTAVAVEKVDLAVLVEAPIWSSPLLEISPISGSSSVGILISLVYLLYFSPSPFYCPLLLCCLYFVFRYLVLYFMVCCKVNSFERCIAIPLALFIMYILMYIQPRTTWWSCGISFIIHSLLIFCCMSYLVNTSIKKLVFWIT